jgi:transposase
MDEREHLLREMVERGMSTRAIARELGIHQMTARRWLARHGLQTIHSAQIAETRAGRSSQMATIVRRCRHHGLTPYRLDTDGQYRCRLCRSDSVVRRRAAVRRILVAEAGGSCRICAYDRYTGALQFHHIDPATKSFKISTGHTRSLASMRAEAAKCVLLCANCHAEIEAGLVDLPLPS